MDRLFSRSYSNRIRSTNWACALCEGPSAYLIFDFSSPESFWRRRGRKLKPLPKKPAYSCIFEPENVNCFKESSFKISPWNPHFTSLGEIFKLIRFKHSGMFTILRKSLSWSFHLSTLCPTWDITTLFCNDSGTTLGINQEIVFVRIPGHVGL